MGPITLKTRLAAVLAGTLLFNGAAWSQDITEWAQPEGIAYWKGMRDHWIREIKTHLLSNLQPKELQVINSIQFTDRIELRFSKLPEARKVGNQRTVYLPTEFLLRCEAINACNYVERELGVPYFTSTFAQYCQSMLEKASATGENLPLKTPFDYADLSKKQRAEYYKDSDHKRTYNASIAMSCHFVIAHEVAHHVLGDVDRPPPKDREDRAKAEIEADKWACDLLSAKGSSAYSGACVLDFEFGLSSQASSKRGFEDRLVGRRLLNILTHISEIDEERLRLSPGFDNEKTQQKLRYEMEMIRQHLKAEED